jgi:hypothetical protein
MGCQNPERRNGITRGRSRVRESRKPGSVRGAGRKASPYRDRLRLAMTATSFHPITTAMMILAMMIPATPPHDDMD